MLPLTTVSCNNLQTFRLAPSSVAAGAAANIAAQLAERDVPLDADLLRLLRTVVWQVRVSRRPVHLGAGHTGGCNPEATVSLLQSPWLHFWIIAHPHCIGTCVQERTQLL